MMTFKRWLPFAVLATLLCGLIYVSLQQVLRGSANDPQIQMAEDTASKLATDTDTVQITSLPRIDMSRSLAPFVMTFDAGGKVISSSGEVDGTFPTPPKGVFSYTKEHGEDRFTWQPKDGVRIAAVMRHYDGRTSGFVLAGRSLREVEAREDILFKEVLLAWGVSLVATLFSVTMFPLWKNNQR